MPSALAEQAGFIDRLFVWHGFSFLRIRLGVGLMHSHMLLLNYRLMRFNSGLQLQGCGMSRTHYIAHV